MYTFETQHDSPNFTKGRGGKKIEFIVIHWWDDPAKNPTYAGAISTLCNKAVGASAHFVATGTGRKVACLVNFTDTAWHAGNFDVNQRSFGIECDPRCRDEDYDVVAELICNIRKAYGNLPLKRHSLFVATRCPGNWNLDRLEEIVKTKVAGNNWGLVSNKPPIVVVPPIAPPIIVTPPPVVIPPVEPPKPVEPPVIPPEPKPEPIVVTEPEPVVEPEKQSKIMLLFIMLKRILEIIISKLKKG